MIVGVHMNNDIEELEVFVDGWVDTEEKNKALFCG